MNLYIAIRTTRPEGLKYQLNSINELNKKLVDTKWTLVPKIFFDCDKIDYVPSWLLTYSVHNASDIKIINNIMRIETELDSWIYLLEENNDLTYDILDLVTNLENTTKDCIITSQLRDTELYKPDIDKLKESGCVGKIDVGQIFLKNTKNKLYVIEEDPYFFAGNTADWYLANDKVEIVSDISMTRNGLPISSKSSKPKVFCINPIDSNIIEKSYANPLKYAELIDNYDVLTSLDDVDEIYTTSIITELTNGITNPTFSIFTSAYNTGEKIRETYESLCNQTYDNWEWVIVNDSVDGGLTQHILDDIRLTDKRVKVFQFSIPTRGNIGLAKWRCCSLCSGKWLVELDHDDLLTSDCLDELYKASVEYPDAGFIYSDAVECDLNYNSLTYNPGFALGFGKYYDYEYNGFKFKVSDTPNQNPLTVRHIVGVPNHVRCWRADIYRQVKGHNTRMRIADDYELILRTWLVTKFIHIRKMLYIQRFDGNNSQDNGNRADIQTRVKVIANYYNELIHNRFNELDIEDYAYDWDKIGLLKIIPRRGVSEQYTNYTIY